MRQNEGLDSNENMENNYFVRFLEINAGLVVSEQRKLELKGLDETHQRFHNEWWKFNGVTPDDDEAKLLYEAYYPILETTAKRVRDAKEIFDNGLKRVESLIYD